MVQLDKQFRLTIPQDIREVVNLNFNEEIRIYSKLKNDIHYLILSNDKELNYACFGIAKFDQKSRFYISKELRNYLNASTETNFLVFSLKGELLIKML